MENAGKKPLIIFDCFGVVVKNDVSMVWLKNTFDDETIKQIRKDYYPDADSGRISGKQLYEKLAYHSNVAAAEIEKIFHSLVEIDDEVIDLIKRLKETNYVVMLSNCFSDFLDDVLVEHKLNELFDKIIVSCDCGLIKPDKEIYLKMLSFFEGKFNDVVMIDDNKVNLIGANNTGIEKTILHTSASKTEQELNKMGIKF